MIWVLIALWPLGVVLAWAAIDSGEVKDIEPDIWDWAMIVLWPLLALTMVIAVVAGYIERRRR